MANCFGVGQARFLCCEGDRVPQAKSVLWCSRFCNHASGSWSILRRSSSILWCGSRHEARANLFGVGQARFLCCGGERVPQATSVLGCSRFCNHACVIWHCSTMPIGTLWRRKGTEHAVIRLVLSKRVSCALDERESPSNVAARVFPLYKTRLRYLARCCDTNQYSVQG